MSKRLPSGIVVLQVTKPDKCELCSKVAELRPYGPNGENICFECGMKDEETTRQQFRKKLFDGPEPKIN
jgi:hypothetical protein